MRLLEYGMRGQDVGRWQQFLLGQGLYTGEVDRHFGNLTHNGTVNFQKKVRHIGVDGSVGTQTLGAAMALGFEPDGLVVQQKASLHGPNWPPVPRNLKPTNYATRVATFGRFRYKPSPTTNNPERIRMLDAWEANYIESVKVPELKGVKGSRWIRMNRLVVPQFLGFFHMVNWLVDVDVMEVDNPVLSFDGGFAPRYIRGSRKSLSNHAWGTAFDINARWNGFGVRPALFDSPGSVRGMVTLANDLGWYWGGHFKARRGATGEEYVLSNRADGMHFEAAKVLSQCEVDSVINRYKEELS